MRSTGASAPSPGTPSVDTSSPDEIAARSPGGLTPPREPAKWSKKVNDRAGDHRSPVLIVGTKVH